MESNSQPLQEGVGLQKYKKEKNLLLHVMIKILFYILFKTPDINTPILAKRCIIWT